MTHVGVIHLGRVGAHLARRLLANGVPCVVYDRNPRTIAELAAERAHGASSVADLVLELDGPRAIWLAGPAAEADATIADMLPHLEPGDVVVECGGADGADAIRRAASLAKAGVHYMDVGVCGELGRPGAACCLTIGGDAVVVRSQESVLKVLVPPQAYLHCGPAGAGHFIKRIHDGIERRLMTDYSEGFRMIRAADTAWTDRDPEHEFDLSAIVNLWRHGAPVASSVMERAADEAAAPAASGGPQTYVHESQPEISHADFDSAGLPRADRTDERVADTRR